MVAGNANRTCIIRYMWNVITRCQIAMFLTSCALCLQGMIMGPKTAISMLVGAILGEGHDPSMACCSRIGTYQQHLNIPGRDMSTLIL